MPTHDVRLTAASHPPVRTTGTRCLRARVDRTAGNSRSNGRTGAPAHCGHNQGAGPAIAGDEPERGELPAAPQRRGQGQEREAATECAGRSDAPMRCPGRLEGEDGAEAEHEPEQSARNSGHVCRVCTGAFSTQQANHSPKVAAIQPYRAGERTRYRMPGMPTPSQLPAIAIGQLLSQVTESSVSSMRVLIGAPLLGTRSRRSTRRRPAAPASSRSRRGWPWEPPRNDRRRPGGSACMDRGP